MKKKALITVKSNVSTEEKDLIEVVTPGEFYIKDGIFTAEYEETKISGMEGTKTTIIIKDESFELIRVGSTETKMEFDSKKGCSALYKTPYGVMEINISTKNIDINMTKNGGIISTAYTLLIEGQEAIKTNLTVEIKVNEN